MIDKYVGWVESVSDGVATLMFKDSSGGEWYGSYNADALQKRGIGFGDHFECEVIETGDFGIELNFKRSEYQGMTPEERYKLYEELMESTKDMVEEEDRIDDLRK
jgi:hypothetical protein